MSDSAFKNFKRVPDKSRLEVEVEVEGKPEDEGKYTADGQFVAATDVIEWDHGDLEPGPARAKLRKGNVYFSKVRLTFLAAATVEVRFTVVRSDGTVHSKPAVFEVKGKQGNVAIRGVFITMEA